MPSDNVIQMSPDRQMIIQEAEQLLDPNYVQRPLEKKYLKEESRKKLGEKLDSFYTKRITEHETLFKLYEILKAIYRGENITREFDEIPDIVHNIVQGPVTTASAKISSAFFSSDLLNKFISSEYGKSDNAERVERYIQAKITEQPQNRDAIFKAIECAALIGVGWTETLVEDQYFAEGSFDIEEIDATDEEQKKATEYNGRRGNKCIRYKYLEPGRIMLDPHIENYFDQPYIIKISHMSSNDLRYKSSGTNPIYDPEIIKEAIKQNPDGTVSTINAKYLTNQEYYHPLFETNENEVGYHLVVDFYRRDGKVFTLVDKEYVVRVQQDTSYSHVSTYTGPPFTPWYWERDYDNPYGLGIGAKLLGLQKTTNLSAGLLYSQQLKDSMQSVVINAKALTANHPEIYNTYYHGKTLFTDGASAKDVISYPLVDTGTWQMGQESMAMSEHYAQQMSGVSPIVSGQDTGGRRTAAQATMTNANAHSTFDNILQRMSMIASPIVGATTLRALKQMYLTNELNPTEYFRVAGPSGQTDYYVHGEDVMVEMDIRPGVDISMANPANTNAIMTQLLTLSIQNPDFLPHEAKYNILRTILKVNNISEPERYIGQRDQMFTIQERIEEMTQAFMSGHFDYEVPVGRYDDHQLFIAQYTQMAAGQLGFKYPMMQQMLMRAIKTHQMRLASQEMKQGKPGMGGQAPRGQGGGGGQPQHGGGGGTYNQAPATYNQSPNTMMG